MRKKGFLSERDAARILRRYDAVTVMCLLREVSRCSNARLDWNALARKSNTGISSAREYQALWRHIAYRAELAECYADDAQPSEDESDLEFELLPSPIVSSDTSAEVVRWVKADMQRTGMSGKRKAEMLSTLKSRDVGIPTVSSQACLSSGLSGGAVNLCYKGIRIAEGPHQGMLTLCPPSPNADEVLTSTPECASGTPFGMDLGQSERKKRKLWSVQEDQELIAGVEKFGEGNWANIQKSAFPHNRTAIQLSQRWTLIRKRKEVQQGANIYASGIKTGSSADGQRVGIQSPPADPNLRTEVVHSECSIVNRTPPPRLSSAVGNCSEGRRIDPTTGLGSFMSSSIQSQVRVTSCPSLSLKSKCVGSGSSTLGTTSTCIGSHVLNGGVIKVEGMNTQTGTDSCQWQAQAVSTSGSSPAVATMGVGKVRKTGSKIVGAGPGRLLAPGALVMSVAAAQAASIGGSEMWHAATLAGVLTSKYGVCTSAAVSSGRGEALTGPNPGVQAAAVAAGARISPASASSSLLKATKSGNVMHIGPGGLPVAKLGLSDRKGSGQDTSVGLHNASGAIVHYIRTGAAAPPLSLKGILGIPKPVQPKNQLPKTVCSDQPSLCPSSSNASSHSFPPSQSK